MQIRGSLSCYPFAVNNGLWPLVPTLVGNATRVVSKQVYV
jgi:hypothetical protein